MCVTHGLSAPISFITATTSARIIAGVADPLRFQLGWIASLLRPGMVIAGTVLLVAQPRTNGATCGVFI